MADVLPTAKTPAFDWSAIARINPEDYAMQAMPGVVVIAAIAWDGVIDGLALPDEAKRRLRPDMGVVVASGERYVWDHFGQRKVSDPSDLPIGSVVVVRRDRGLVVHGFGWDRPVESASEIRAYGVNGGPGTFVAMTRYPYDDAVLALVDMDTMDVTAVGRRVIVRLQKRTLSDVLVVPDGVARYDVVATVVSVGKDADGVAVGDQVLVGHNQLHGLGDSFKDLASVPVDGILAVNRG